MVDVDDSISECLIVYLVVWISSVKGALNATLFVAGNIGLDCANDVMRAGFRAIGLLSNIDFTL